MTDREDLLPHYRDDLMDKAARVRKAIMELVAYKLPDLKDVTPEEYDIIRLAVINSIKGEAIALEEKSRQEWVEEVFLSPAEAKRYLTYVDTSGVGKCDFEGKLTNGERFGLEVKGGEGNSVTLLSRPANADLLAVWSHLDVMSNTPAENMRAVLGRVVKQMVNSDEKKQKVDYLVFYDKWYKSGIKLFKQGVPLPDVIVFPTAIPAKNNQHPPQGDPSKSFFLEKLYDVVGAKPSLSDPLVRRHVWLCDLEVLPRGGKWYRKMSVRNWQHPDVTLTAQDSTEAQVKVIDRL